MESGLDDLTARAAQTNGQAKAAVDLARAIGPEVPMPGSGQGQTARRWAVLSEIAAGDLSAARIVEAHLDALAIRAEAGDAAPDGETWGVFAAEGPGLKLTATQEDRGWVLDGTKPWCSAAHLLDRALVTAQVADGDRRLFAVDLRSPGVQAAEGVWVARGLADVASGPVEFDSVPARPVGENGWYLRRSGFAWGGMGVAACWYGGMVALARTLWSAAGSREPDQIALLHLGQVDRLVEHCRLVLADAAQRIDAGRADGESGVLLAERVRGSVAVAAESVLSSVGHALGPAPLALDEDHARRVADLQLYLRQHHAERDSARLGRLLLDTGRRPW